MIENLEKPATDPGLIGTLASLLGGVLVLIARHVWDSAKENKRNEMAKENPERASELLRIVENTARIAALLEEMVDNHRELRTDMKDVREAQIELRTSIRRVEDRCPRAPLNRN